MQACAVAGGVVQLCVREHPGQRTVRDAVNVLFRAQGGADGAVIELLGQGTEQKTAVDAVVSVHLVQYPKQLLLRGVGGSTNCRTATPTLPQRVITPRS